MTQNLPFKNRFRRPHREIIIPKRVAERAATRFVVGDADCHISTYSTGSHGYAQVGWNEGGSRSATTAHRAAWVQAIGQQIPEGMTIDHLCKERRCVNPDHLRLLDNFENARRTSGRDWETGQCINGHPNSELYWDGSRYRCKPCTRRSQAKYVENNREKVREAKKRSAAKKKAA